MRASCAAFDSRRQACPAHQDLDKVCDRYVSSATMDHMLNANPVLKGMQLTGSQDLPQHSQLPFSIPHKDQDEE